MLWSYSSMILIHLNEYQTWLGNITTSSFISKWINASGMMTFSWWVSQSSNINFCDHLLMIGRLYSRQILILKQTSDFKIQHFPVHYDDHTQLRGYTEFSYFLMSWAWVPLNARRISRTWRYYLLWRSGKRVPLHQGHELHLPAHPALLPVPLQGSRITLWRRNKRLPGPLRVPLWSPEALLLCMGSVCSGVGFIRICSFDGHAHVLFSTVLFNHSAFTSGSFHIGRSLVLNCSLNASIGLRGWATWIYFWFQTRVQYKLLSVDVEK